MVATPQVAPDCGQRLGGYFINFNSPPPAPDVTGSKFDCSYDNVSAVCQDAVQRFRIHRVVGNGLMQPSSEFGQPTVDSTGRLIDAGSLVQGGVVSRFARIRLSFNHLRPTGTATIQVKLNGRAITSWTIQRNQVYSTRCLSVPIEYLRFGQRTAADSTSAPLPGLNAITFSMNRPNPGIWVNGEAGYVTAQVDSIAFETLAPVLFVHGIRSSGGDFLRNQRFGEA